MSHTKVSKSFGQKTGYTTESMAGNFGRATFFTDPLAGYSASNEQLIKQDSIIQKVLLFLQYKLFSDGVVFLSNGKIETAPDDFQTDIDHYWIPFLHKALAFIFARGFLVFRVYINDKGHSVPDVPD